MSTPQVSVIMPVADVAHWVDEAIESVLMQDVDLELIVAIDRSTDGTAERIARSAERDSRVRPFASGGVGGGTARNLAIERAAGRYLAFADGDDLVATGAYAALIASMQRSGSPMAVGDYLKLAPASSLRRGDQLPIFQPRRGITLSDEPRFLRDRVAWIRLIDREAWNAEGIAFSTTRRANDAAAMVRAYCAFRFDVIDRPVYYYRRRSGSGSMTAQRESAPLYADYIHEETRSVDLVEAHGDARVTRAFTRGVLAYDLPHHVNPRLAAMFRERDNDRAGLEETVVLAERLLEHGGPPSRFERVLPLMLLRSGNLAGAQLAAATLAGEPSTATRRHRADLRSAIGRVRELPAEARRELLQLIDERERAASDNAASDNAAPDK